MVEVTVGVGVVVAARECRRNEVWWIWEFEVGGLLWFHRVVSGRFPTSLPRFLRERSSSLGGGKIIHGGVLHTWVMG